MFTVLLLCDAKVLAGSAEFKQQLERSDLLDPRLMAIILCAVDVAYGMQAGFSQAIDLSKNVLGNVKFVKEKKVVGNIFLKTHYKT